MIISTKLRHGDANTMMAEGGIQAATKGWKDSPYYHYLDVMGGGHFTNKPELVQTLVNEAPDVIRWLLELGCNFSKHEDGTLTVIFDTIPAEGLVHLKPRLFAGDSPVH